MEANPKVNQRFVLRRAREFVNNWRRFNCLTEFPSTAEKTQTLFYRSETISAEP